MSISPSDRSRVVIEAAFDRADAYSRCGDDDLALSWLDRVKRAWLDRRRARAR